MHLEEGQFGVEELQLLSHQDFIPLTFCHAPTGLQTPDPPLVFVVVGRVLKPEGSGYLFVLGSIELTMLPPPFGENLAPPPLVHVDDEMAMSAQARNSS